MNKLCGAVMISAGPVGPWTAGLSPSHLHRWYIPPPDPSEELRTKKGWVFLFINSHKNVTSIKHIYNSYAWPSVDILLHGPFPAIGGMSGRRRAGGFVCGGCGWGRTWVYYTEWACCVTNTTRLRRGFAQRCNA